MARIRKIQLENKVPSIKQLDDLTRDIVRERDKFKCRRCGREKKHGWKLEVAHFYSRAIKSTRWDLDNVFLLCFCCHYGWAHRDPRAFSEWVKEQLGEETFEMLKIRSTGHKTDRSAVKLYLLGEQKK